MRCDVIALGLIRAAAETGMKKPLVVRLAGTNVEEAKKLIEDRYVYRRRAHLRCILMSYLVLFPQRPADGDL